MMNGDNQLLIEKLNQRLSLFEQEEWGQINLGRTVLEYTKNPSSNALGGLLKDFGELRGIMDSKNNCYFWDAYTYVHHDFARALKLPLPSQVEKGMLRFKLNSKREFVYDHGNTYIIDDIGMWSMQNEPSWDEIEKVVKGVRKKLDYLKSKYHVTIPKNLETDLKAIESGEYFE